jgi:6-phosphogluconolactonase
MDLEVAPDAAALAERAAQRLAGAARRAIAERGRFCLAVSGGRTPSAMFGQLARQDLPWDRVHLFQVDERVAPDGDPARNLVDLAADLLDRVPAHAHLMDVTAEDLDAAAASYGAELHDVCDGRLDLVHLGLGDDGHTASWPPDDAVLEARQDVALVGPFNGHRRLTLTPPAVNRAGSILFLVSGAAKRGPLGSLLRGDRALPASHVRDDALILADADADPGPI